MTPNSFNVLSVLLHKDGNAWVAQCLEVDVAAQGATVAEAKNRFLSTLAAQILFDVRDNRPPLFGLPRAPARYFNSLGEAVMDGPELPVCVPKDSSAVSARFLLRAA